MKVYIEDEYLNSKGMLKKTGPNLIFVYLEPIKSTLKGYSFEWTISKIKKIRDNKKTPFFRRLRFAIHDFWKTLKEDI